MPEPDPDPSAAEDSFELEPDDVTNSKSALSEAVYLHFRRIRTLQGVLANLVPAADLGGAMHPPQDSDRTEAERRKLLLH